MKELVKNPELLKAGGEEKIMTVTFSDLAGFASISEEMTYVELSKHMNEYLTEMTAIILDEEGTVTQYAGDMVMALYGAPVPVPDHAHRAARVFGVKSLTLTNWFIRLIVDGNRVKAIYFCQ